MPKSTTETRTFVGESKSYPGSGYAGYIVGTTYHMRFTRQADGLVCIEGVGESVNELVLVSTGLFERWWIK